MHINICKKNFNNYHLFFSVIQHFKKVSPIYEIKNKKYYSVSGKKIYLLRITPLSNLRELNNQDICRFHTEYLFLCGWISGIFRKERSNWRLDKKHFRRFGLGLQGYFSRRFTEILKVVEKPVKKTR